MKTLRLLLTGVLAGLLLAGCGSSKKLLSIDNALLDMVPQEEMVPIFEARTKRDAAEDALAVAKRDLKLAREEEQLSRASLKRYKARYAESKVALQIAEEDGTASRIQAASLEYSYSSARSEQARAGLVAAERGLKRCELALDTAEEAHRHALARVELEKATALQGADRGDVQGILLEDYRAQFEKSDKRLAKLRDKLEREDRRFAEATEKWEAARREASEIEERMTPADEDGASKAGGSAPGTQS